MRLLPSPYIDELRKFSSQVKFSPRVQKTANLTLLNKFNKIYEIELATAVYYVKREADAVQK